MEFKKVISARYSCKKFSARQVEGDKLNAILEAGPLPNHDSRKPLADTVTWL